MVRLYVAASAEALEQVLGATPGTVARIADLAKAWHEAARGLDAVADEAAWRAFCAAEAADHLGAYHLATNGLGRMVAWRDYCGQATGQDAADLLRTQAYKYEGNPEYQGYEARCLRLAEAVENGTFKGVCWS